MIKGRSFYIGFGFITTGVLSLLAGTALAVSLPSHRPARALPGSSPSQSSPGEIDDNNPSIIYSLNNWSVNSFPGDYRGTEADSNFSTNARTYQVQGADVMVNFYGTGIQWIGRTGPNYGIASYSVDGFAPNTVDNYSSNPAAQTVNAAISGLDLGSHVLKIEVTPYSNPASSNLYQAIDAFVIEGGAAPPAQGSSAGYNQATYTGQWDCGTANNDLSGGHCWSWDAAATVSWTFNGSLVEVFGRPDLEDGIFNVLVDGVQVGQVDGHFGAVDNDSLNAYCFFVWKGPPGTHTITLVVTGTQDADAGGAVVQFDEFLAFP